MKTKQAKRFFDSLASEWEECYELDFSDIITSNLSQKRRRVLDLECGTGRHSKILSKFFDSTYGLDISDGMLLEAKKLDNLRLVKGTAENLPFPDNCFDMIVSINLLPTAENRGKVVDEAKRTLKRDGTLLLIVSTIRDLKLENTFVLVRNLLRYLISEKPSLYELLRRVKFHIKFLKRLLCGAGLSRKEFEKYLRKFENYRINFIDRDRGYHGCGICIK